MQENNCLLIFSIENQKKVIFCCEYFQEFDRNHKDVVGMYRTHLISAVQVCFFHQIAF